MVLHVHVFDQNKTSSAAYRHKLLSSFTAFLSEQLSYPMRLTMLEIARIRLSLVYDISFESMAFNHGRCYPCLASLV